MRRSLKYIAFASASVFSCTLLMYKTRGDNKLGTLYAAADGRSAEVLRSGPAFEIQNWNKNWDFREPNYGARPKTPDKHSVPSLAEHFGEVDEQKAGLGKPSATRHLLFIRHGQYVKAEEDEKKVLTYLGRFVCF
ncbi:Hypothetical predicted protein [Paramuricea clavata]|uniref:Uncharacterized protein n=1 Tax=Paramuricea clavata TaxID=317549 RepID=A0A6S7HK93_PARCT|nr:Hypothetical predicted protein [Paramuricea clavata]